MKKSVIFVGLLLSLFGFYGISFAGDISDADKLKIDLVMTTISQNIKGESIESKITKYENLIDSFSKNSFTGRQESIAIYLSESIQNKINRLKSQQIKQKDFIPNVDRDQVQQQRLQWHNEEREKKGLPPYTIDDTLNYTALNRAKVLSDTNKKNNTHQRSENDGYYSYDSIKNWFNDLGVYFDYEKTAFTESNAYQYYNCKKTDCTAEMISVLKKCYEFLSGSSSHYPAIIHPYFDKIGVGVSKSGNWIRVTTHYGINVNQY